MQLKAMYRQCNVIPLLLRCSEASRPEERRRTVGRETNAAAEAAADQDGQGEGGVEEEDEGEVRSQVWHPWKDSLHGPRVRLVWWGPGQQPHVRLVD